MVVEETNKKEDTKDDSNMLDIPNEGDQDDVQKDGGLAPVEELVRVRVKFPDGVRD